MNKGSLFDHAIFKKKPITRESDTNDDRFLKRTLSTFDLVMLGIGGIIGMGIFVLSGIVAGLHAGTHYGFHFSLQVSPAFLLLFVMQNFPP